MNRLRLFLLKMLLGKEGNDMAVVYATLIIKGYKTLEQVPTTIRPQVEEIIEALEVKI